MRVIALVPLLASTAAVQARGQVDQIAFHSRVVDFIATRSPGVLPTGDTLVSWNGDHPVLFHTGARDSLGVRAGLLRADRMLGSADVRWARGTPESFVVRWLTPRSISIDSLVIRGSVDARGLHISRSHSRDTVLAVPARSWAVADYGMEELLLPVFEAITGNTVTSIAVFRPYGQKWDTLRVSAGPAGNGWRVIRWSEKDGTNWTAVLEGSHLLWVRRSDHPDNETVALEGTAIRAILDRIRAQVEPASMPTRPNEG